MNDMKKIKWILVLCLGIFFSTNFLQSEESDSNSGEAKKYNLSVCAIFKNEAKYLKEWLEYHLLVGVDHFYLYNNNSTDNYMRVLRRYIQDGIVTLIQWPYEAFVQNDDDFMKAQASHVSAYENAAKFAAINATKWLVFVNIDEYLLPPTTDNLKDILEKYDEYPGVILARDHFDSSLDGAFAKHGLLIETADRTAAPKEKIDKSVEKTIFKPDQYTYFFLAPYRFVFKDNQVAARLDKSEMRINRYLNRTAKYTFWGKTNDNESSRTTHEGLNYLREDNNIERFIPDLRARLAENAG